MVNDLVPAEQELVGNVTRRQLTADVEPALGIPGKGAIRQNDAKDRKDRLPFAVCSLQLLILC